jgi:hypothetical protein
VNFLLDSGYSVLRVFSLGVKRPVCEADHLPQSSSEVKNAWSYTLLPLYTFMAWCSVKAQKLYLLRAGWTWVRDPAVAGNLSHYPASVQNGSGPNQPPFQWIPGAPSLGVKRPGAWSWPLTSFNAEVKNTWSYTSTPPIRLHGLVLSQRRGTYLPFTSMFVVITIFCLRYMNKKWKLIMGRVINTEYPR